MIVLNLGATMRCAEEGCAESLPVDLCLLATGGFGFKPTDLEAAKKWQLQAASNGAFVARCHEHRQTINVVQSEGAQVRQLVPASSRKH